MALVLAPEKIGSTRVINAAERHEGVGLLRVGDVVYAGMVERTSDEFRLYTVNVSTGALTQVGTDQSLGDMNSPSGVGLAQVDDTVYAGVVDSGDDEFRLYTVNVSTGALTQVGTDQSLGDMDAVRGTALTVIGGFLYAGIVDSDDDEFRLYFVSLFDGSKGTIVQQGNDVSLEFLRSRGVGIAEHDDVYYVGVVNRSPQIVGSNFNSDLAWYTLSFAISSGSVLSNLALDRADDGASLGLTFAATGMGMVTVGDAIYAGFLHSDGSQWDFWRIAQQATIAPQAVSGSPSVDASVTGGPSPGIVALAQTGAAGASVALTPPRVIPTIVPQAVSGSPSVDASVTGGPSPGIVALAQTGAAGASVAPRLPFQTIDDVSTQSGAPTTSAYVVGQSLQTQEINLGQPTVNDAIGIFYADVGNAARVNHGLMADGRYAWLSHFQVTITDRGVGDLIVRLGDSPSASTQETVRRDFSRQVETTGTFTLTRADGGGTALDFRVVDLASTDTTEPYAWDIPTAREQEIRDFMADWLAADTDMLLTIRSIQRVIAEGRTGAMTAAASVQGGTPQIRPSIRTGPPTVAATVEGGTPEVRPMAATGAPVTAAAIPAATPLVGFEARTGAPSLALTVQGEPLPVPVAVQSGAPVVRPGLRVVFPFRPYYYGIDGETGLRFTIHATEQGDALAQSLRDRMLTRVGTRPGRPDYGAVQADGDTLPDIAGRSIRDAFLRDPRVTDVEYRQQGRALRFDIRSTVRPMRVTAG